MNDIIDRITKIEDIKEYPIGSRFMYNEMLLEVCKSPTHACEGCFLYKECIEKKPSLGTVLCSILVRKDKQSVIYKKVDMGKYTVKPEDLIGEIKGFPIEVVQKMVDYQKTPNVTVFQQYVSRCECYGGFDWHKTNEGKYFWDDVLRNKKFDIFFEKYPIITEEPLMYCPEIYDRAIKNVMNQYKCNASTAFHYYIEGKCPSIWFSWEKSTEGSGYWNNIEHVKYINNPNYKITYHVKSRLQKEETSGRVSDDSGRSKCESGDTAACPQILHFDHETTIIGETAIIEGFKDAISSSYRIHY